MYAKGLMNMAGGDASGDGPMDLLSDAIKATLHPSTYAPSQSADETKSDATNEAANGSGYTTGGVTLASKTFTSSSLVVTFDAADLSWTALTKTFRYIVCWDDTPTSPADPLILYVDSGGDQSLSGTDLAIVWNASGIFTLTAS
jgi:hypothetical protein